jgi:RNA polymerase sigma-70 factor (ECF subfamily)
MSFTTKADDASPKSDVTSLLAAWRDGDEHAFERVVPLVYDELHRMAVRYMAGESARVTMQPTALVNDVCIRLLGWHEAQWQNRGHFFAVSAQMMRRVLVDIARRRSAERRGGTSAIRVPLDDIDVAARQPDAELVALDAALERLAVEDSRKARVVELRFFGGLSMDETAQALGISLRTAHNDWAFARAWLYGALTRSGTP